MRIFVIIMLAAALFSCGGESDDSFDYAEFLSEKAAWESQNIDHYRFLGFTVSSIAPQPPATITVFPDKEPVVSFEEVYGDDGKHYNYAYPFAPFYGRTITELYSDIERIVTTDIYSNQIRKYATIKYNKQYHYPEEADLSLRDDNPMEEGGMMAVVALFLYIYSFEDLRGQ